MRTILRYVPLLAGLAIVSPSAAKESRWKVIASRDTDTLWVDSRTIQRSGPDQYRVWLRTGYGEGQELESGKVYDYVIVQEDHDCTARKSRLLSVTYDRKDGRVVGTAEWSELPFRAVAPDSYGEKALEGVCAFVGS